MKVLRKILLLLMAMSLFIVQVGEVSARSDIDISYVDVEEETSDSAPKPNKEVPPFMKSDTGNKKRDYWCTYKTNSYPTSKYEIGVYDANNNDIIEKNLNIDAVNLPLAGTAIGINIQERKTTKIIVNNIRVTVSGEKTTIKRKSEYMCTYKTQEPQWVFTWKNGALLDYEYIIPDKECEVTEDIVTKNECKDPKEIGKYCELNTGPEWIRTYEYAVTEPIGYDIVIELVKNNSKIELIETLDTISVGEYNIKDTEDLKAVSACVDLAANRALEKGTWNRKPAYNIELSNSNDVNATEGLVRINASSVKEEQYLDKNKQPMECTTWDNCPFKYKPGEIIGNTYKLGYIYSHDGYQKKPGVLWDLRYAYLYYKKDKTCLNAKTAKARYIESTQKCGPDEFEILNETTPDGYEHWHYFIPLNAKNQDGIEIKMLESNSSTLTEKQCLSVMNKYYKIRENSDFLPAEKEYVKLIKPYGVGEAFKGDYYCVDKCGTEEAVFNINSSDYQKIKTDQKCYLTSVVEIPVKQLFYNEVLVKKNEEDTTEQSMLKGFNFYYKPINSDENDDIAKIFPNGVTAKDGKLIKPTNTLWETWYENYDNTLVTNEKYKSIKLDKETVFGTVTYLAQNIKLKKIRDYTQNNPYTSWDNMNSNGQSGFITYEGIVTRDTPGEIYKLGCGPLNSTKNLLDTYGNEIKDISGNAILNPMFNRECAT